MQVNLIDFSYQCSGSPSRRVSRSIFRTRTRTDRNVQDDPMGEVGWDKKMEKTNRGGCNDCVMLGSSRSNRDKPHQVNTLP